MFLPHLHVPKSRFLFSVKAVPLEEFTEASVCVVQRQCTADNIKALERFRQLGMKIVYDLDDNLWNLPAYNQGKRLFNQMRDGFATCIELSDILTVSTEGLRTAVKGQFPGMRKEIIVVPNAIDFELLHPPIRPKGEGIVVGYAGTNTHSGDVNDAWGAITELLLSRQVEEHVRFEFVGMPPPNRVASHKQVGTRPFVPVSEFFARFSSWAWDVSLAPLTQARFNVSKSNIKILEAAAVGIPILVSPVGPYAAFCERDPELKYLQCLSRASWEQKIKELIAEPELRAKLAAKMLEVAKAHYDIRNVARQWEKVFDRVLAS